MELVSPGLSEGECEGEKIENYELTPAYYCNLGEIQPIEPEDSNKIFPHAKKENYKRKRLSKPFIEFVLEKSGKLLKKDNYRTKIIRAHKKAIRSALSPKNSIKTLNRINNFNQKDYWKIFKNHAQQNSQHLEMISMTKYGPKSDGNKRKSEEQKLMAHNSYNGKYCSDYFSCEVTRTSFSLYCDYVFMSRSCDEFIKMLNYFCCKDNKHDESCEERWRMLEEYTRKTMVEELKYYN